MVDIMKSIGVNFLRNVQEVFFGNNDKWIANDIYLSDHCIQRFYERVFHKGKIPFKTVRKHRKQMKKKVINYIRDNASNTQLESYQSLSNDTWNYNNKLFIPFGDKWVIIVGFSKEIIVKEKIPFKFVTIWPKEWRDDSIKIKKLELAMYHSKHFSVN